MVDTADNVTAARHVNGDKGLKLLHNTVTECNSELLDNVEVKRLDHIEVYLLYGMLEYCLIVESLNG